VQVEAGVVVVEVEEVSSYIYIISHINRQEAHCQTFLHVLFLHQEEVGAVEEEVARLV